MNRRVIIYAIAVLCLAGCKKNILDPAEPARLVLQDALTALEEHDFGRYLEHADMGIEMDTFQIDFMHKAVLQHQLMQEATRGRCTSIDIIDWEMESDTVCQLYYQLSFADSTKDVSSQKMIRKDGVWKIRLRN